MNRIALFFVGVISLSLSALANQRAQGDCMQGGHVAVINGINSSARVMQSYVTPSLPSSTPTSGCTVSVFITGSGGTLATLTAKTGGGTANPFTADATGHWYFEASNGEYDITLSSAGIVTPFTLGAVKLFDEEILFLDVTAHGARGNGTTDDTTAIQAVLTSACSGTIPAVVFFPAGTYLTTSLLSCTAYNSNGVKLMGFGPESIIHSTSTSGALLITGSKAFGSDNVYINDLQLQSTVTAPFSLKMLGVANFGITNLNINNLLGTVTNGIYFVGSQQGYVKGGEIFATSRGIRLERASGTGWAVLTGSNGIEQSGISINGNGLASGSACWEIEGADDAFIHSNHCVNTDYGVHLLAPGGSGFVSNGQLTIDGNHIETSAVGGLVSDSGWNGVEVSFTNNSVYNTAPSVNVLGTGVVHVLNNLLDGDVTFGANCLSCLFITNRLFGVLTDSTSGSTLVQYSNSTGALNPEILLPARFFSQLVVQPPFSFTPGHMAIFLPNGNFSGTWGVKITGGGTGQETYLQIHNVSLSANTSGGILDVKSAPGGTTWGRFTPTQFSVPTRNIGIGTSSSGVTALGLNYSPVDGTIYNTGVNGWAFNANLAGSNQLILSRYNGAGFLRNDMAFDASSNVTFPAKVNSVTGFQLNSVDGFTGSKVAGSCTLTIQGGIITNVTGC